MTHKFIIILSIVVISLVSSALVGAKTIAKKNSAIYSLQWLGPLPPKIKLESAASNLYSSAMQKVKKNVAALSNKDILSFSCKKPEEVGPVSEMVAVDTYIDGLPESNESMMVISQLFHAAERGNWLARLQTYSHLSDRSEKADMKYQAAKIFKWLVDKDVGGIYSLIGYALESTGYYSGSPGDLSTGFDFYAALHNGYPAQHKVGSELSKHDEPEMAAVGRRMVECAENSIPSYRKVFTGEAEKMRAEREKRFYEESYLDLHWAVLRNQVDKVRDILEKNSSKINLRTKDDHTAIEFALLQSEVNPDIVSLLISKGAEIRNYGSVVGGDGSKLGGGLLSLAVRAKSSNVEVVRMLVEAGADPFNPPPSFYSFQMPFYEAFDDYEKGNVEILNYFISTNKLDKNSRVAKAYLVDSIGKWKVFRRLLDYGISPAGADNFLSKLGRSYYPSQGGKEMLAMVTQRFPLLLRDIEGASGGDAIANAVYDCNFGFANDLVEFGAPLMLNEAARAEGLVRTLVSRCGRVHTDEVSEKHEDLVTRRRSFLHQMVKSGGDLNALEGDCPAWTTIMCAPPDDDDLAELFLQLGADPYRFYPKQSHSILGAMIAGCRVALVGQALATPPAQLDEDTLAGLAGALAVVRRPIWEGHNCPDNFASKTAEILISYGAEEE